MPQGRGSAHFHMFPASGHVNIVEYVIGSICRGSFATNRWNNKSPRVVESKQKSWTTCEAKSADGLEEDSKEMEVDVDGTERQRRRGSSEEQEDKLEECQATLAQTPRFKSVIAYAWFLLSIFELARMAGLVWGFALTTTPVHSSSGSVGSGSDYLSHAPSSHDESGGDAYYFGPRLGPSDSVARRSVRDLNAMWMRKSCWPAALAGQRHRDAIIFHALRHQPKHPHHGGHTIVRKVSRVQQRSGPR